MTQQKTAKEILLRRNIVFHYKDQLTVYNRLYVLDLIAAMEEYASSQTEQLRKENESLRQQLAEREKVKDNLRWPVIASEHALQDAHKKHNATSNNGKSEFALAWRLSFQWARENYSLTPLEPPPSQEQLEERKKAQVPDLEQIKEAINLSFEKVTGDKLEPDEWSEHFEQLRVDEMDFVEFVMAIEAHFQISVPDNIADNLRHPKDWVVYLQSCLEPFPKQEVEQKPDFDRGCKCQQCGAIYKIDVIVDDAVWEKIKPKGKAEGAGLLCGSCILNRLEALNIGHSVVFIPERNKYRKEADNQWKVIAKKSEEISTLQSRVKELEQSDKEWLESHEALLGRRNELLDRVKSLEAENEELRKHAHKLQQFKEYVHKRLDDFGVPADPEPEKNAEHGCRIEGRLNWLDYNWKYREY